MHSNHFCEHCFGKDFWAWHQFTTSDTETEAQRY